MNDKEFLQWIHDRLIQVHRESGLKDYMHKLRSIINATDSDKYTPNVCSSCKPNKLLEQDNENK